MVRAAASLAMACCLLGAPSVSGVKLVLDEQEATSLEMEESMSLVLALGRMSLAGLPWQFNTSRLRILSDLQDNRLALQEEDEGYDCAAQPHMCEAPFHCDKWTHQDTVDVKMHGLATPDGHPNLRTWCMPGLTRYANGVVKHCHVDGMIHSAHTTQRGDHASELEASYCFAEGHCNFHMDSSRTLKDMEKMCDHRFGGRKGWTRNFISSLKRLMDMPGVFSRLASDTDGYHTQRITRVLSKMACAQGIFHCDVDYCKRTYCRDEYYAKKYSKLLPTIKGELIEDPDLTRDVLPHKSQHTTMWR